MGLEQRIDEDYVAAMKAGEAERRNTLRLLRAALKNAGIEARGPLSEEAVTRVLVQQAKMRRDSIEQYDAGGRADLADAERAELAVIESYLPRQLAPDEIEAEARRVIAAAGAHGPGDMGQVMRQLMADLAGRADGKVASDIVRRLLTG
jgi:uncharacterized protein